MDDKRDVAAHGGDGGVSRRQGGAGAPESFRRLAAPDGTRADAGEDPRAFIGDLFDWALTRAGAEAWNDSTPLEWDREVARFFAALTRFDEFLASEAPLATPPERIFQGAVADALTHRPAGDAEDGWRGARMPSGNYCASADRLPGRRSRRLEAIRRRGS